MIAATELDLNNVVQGVVAIVLAWFGYVTIRTNLRLKGVDRKTEQLVANGGESMRDDVSGITRQISRLSAESSERWNVTLQMQDTLSRVHGNQVTAMAAAQDLIREVAAIKQAQLHHDQRMTLLESHSSEKFARMESALAELQKRIDALTPSLDNQYPTPPQGVPVVKS